MAVVDWPAIASQLESSVSFLERQERRARGTDRHAEAVRDLERARTSLLNAQLEMAS